VKLLIAGAKELQIPLKSEHLQAFQTYCQELVAWNNKFNLTAITDYEGIQIRHFLDSISCLLALEKKGPLTDKQLIDVGTGAGFPGIPLKIMRPTIKLTLLESTAKKVSFLNHITSLLGLHDVTIVNERAETLGKNPEHREKYDWAIARAVAEMPILAEYMLPFVKIGGCMLAQKVSTLPLKYNVQNGQLPNLEAIPSTCKP